MDRNSLCPWCGNTGNMLNDGDVIIDSDVWRNHKYKLQDSIRLINHLFILLADYNLLDETWDEIIEWRDSLKGEQE